MTLTARPIEELPVEYRLGEPVESGAIAVIIQNRTHWVAFLMEDINTLVNKDIIIRYMSNAKYSLEHPHVHRYDGEPIRDIWVSDEGNRFSRDRRACRCGEIATLRIWQASGI